MKQVPEISGWVTVVSTDLFDESAAKLLAPDEIDALVDYVAINPTAGAELGSGVRKLRWAIPGRGKSGGVRIIHLFADSRTPVVLLDVFAKNDKVNYSPKELAEIRALAKEILAGFRGE